MNFTLIQFCHTSWSLLSHISFNAMKHHMPISHLSKPFEVRVDIKTRYPLPKYSLLVAEGNTKNRGMLRAMDLFKPFVARGPLRIRD